MKNPIMKNIIYKAALSMAFLILICCSQLQQKTINFDRPIKNTKPITLDTVFERLVIVDSLGVTGADGVISFSLNETTSVFMMGDSFMSPVQNKKRAVDSKMINNTFILIDEEKNSHKAFYGGTLDEPESLLKPTYGNTKEFFWPGHGFENKGILHIFMSRFVHVDYGWGFEFSGTDYIRINSDNFEIVSQEDIQFSNINRVHYGHSVVEDTKFVYIYGAYSDSTSTGMHVMRSKLDRNKNSLGQYEFFNGSDWVNDPLKSAPLAGIQHAVPEQFSIFKQDSTYILVMQERNLISGNIYSYIADSPTGPWRNPKLLYHTLEQDRGIDNVFTYNAMAHPQYLKNNELLISYCVNSFDIPKIHEVNTDYYRPRFIRVPMQMILE